VAGKGSGHWENSGDNIEKTGGQDKRGGSEVILGADLVAFVTIVHYSNAEGRRLEGRANIRAKEELKAELESSRMAWDFVINFAKDNDLQMAEACLLPDVSTR
jgi:hypothetical protein